MKKNVFYLFLLVSSLVANMAYANDNNALVLGYQSFTRDEIWHEKKVGIGVKNLVQQRLVDKNMFSLIKLKNADENALLDDEKLATKNLEKIATENKLNHIFWVNIQNFSSATSKFIIPFFNSGHYDDTLVLKICHYVVATKSTDCQEGEATELRALSGELYDPATKVHFNESAAARLSQKAITDVFSELFPDD
jgi:hypothetical protein